MAQTSADQRASLPLAAYNFRVTVDGVAMRFAKVSGLQREYPTLTYRHGLSFLEGEELVRFGMDRFVSITMEQGTVIGSRALYAWLEAGTRATMEVSLCDAEGLPVVTWRATTAIPVKLSAPAFDARNNEVSIDTLEVKASGITVVHQG